MRGAFCDLVPEGWLARTVEDVCTRVGTGGTPSRRRPDFWLAGQIPWIKTQELQDVEIRDTSEHINELGLRESSARLYPPQTVFMALYASPTVGRLGFSGLPMTCNQACVAMDVDPKRADWRYLFYQLRVHRDQLQSVASGSAQQNLSGALVRSLQLPFPGIPEQRAIARVLGTLDDKLGQNKRTAEVLERLARAIFRAWFVDFEPIKARAAGATTFPPMPQPVFDALPARFVDSDIGPVPEGWEVKSLDKVADFLNGLALQTYPPREDDTDLPVIKIAQLRKGSTEGAESSNDSIDDKYKIQDGDLLFSWSGTLEAVFWFGGPGALNQHLFKVTSDRYPPWLTYEWIHQHMPEFRLIAASKATTMGHIKRGHLHEARVVVPSATVLWEADRVVGPLHDLYAQLMIESRRLAEMRDYLLPKLLSGQVRVEISHG